MKWIKWTLTNILETTVYQKNSMKLFGITFTLFIFKNGFSKKDTKFFSEAICNKTYWEKGSRTIVPVENCPQTLILTLTLTLTGEQFFSEANVRTSDKKDPDKRLTKNWGPNLYLMATINWSWKYYQTEY